MPAISDAPKIRTLVTVFHPQRTRVRVRRPKNTFVLLRIERLYTLLKGYPCVLQAVGIGFTFGGMQVPRARLAADTQARSQQEENLD